MLKIGKFILHHPNQGKIWINTVDGEGGSFDAAELELLIEQFWKENF